MSHMMNDAQQMVNHLNVACIYLPFLILLNCWWDEPHVTELISLLAIQSVYRHFLLFSIAIISKTDLELKPQTKVRLQAKVIMELTPNDVEGNCLLRCIVFCLNGD